MKANKGNYDVVGVCQARGTVAGDQVGQAGLGPIMQAGPVSRGMDGKTLFHLSPVGSHEGLDTVRV